MLRRAAAPAAGIISRDGFAEHRPRGGQMPESYTTTQEGREYRRTLRGNRITSEIRQIKGLPPLSFTGQRKC
jgi:hypothetical protein